MTDLGLIRDSTNLISKMAKLAAIVIREFYEARGLGDDTITFTDLDNAPRLANPNAKPLIQQVHPKHLLYHLLQQHNHPPQVSLGQLCLSTAIFNV